MFIKFKILSANNKYQTPKKISTWISFPGRSNKGGNGQAHEGKGAQLVVGSGRQLIYYNKCTR